MTAGIGLGGKSGSMSEGPRSEGLRRSYASVPLHKLGVCDGRSPTLELRPIEQDRHCEERSDEATQGLRDAAPGLLRCADKKQTS